MTFLQAPDFILAGVQKAGTTALFALLRFHPQIVPSLHFEEHFFDMRYGGLTQQLRWGRSTNKNGIRQQHGRLAGQALSCAMAQAYVERMDFATPLQNKLVQYQRYREKQKQLQQHPYRFITFEKTPNYILWPHIPKAIVQTCPWKPKVIIMLRNPVDRLYSHYQMYYVQQRGEEEDGGFEQREVIVPTLEELLNDELRMLRKHRLVQPDIPLVPSPPSNYTATDATTTSGFFQIPNVTRQYRNEKDSINFRGFGNHGDYHRFLYRGMYFFQLERWLSRFSADGENDDVVDTADDETPQQRRRTVPQSLYTVGSDLLVINYEHFKRETRGVMDQVYNFVGVDPKVSFQLTDAQVRATYRPGIDYENRQAATQHAPPLAWSTRHYLEHFYRPYNERLADLLGNEWRHVWESGER